MKKVNYKKEWEKLNKEMFENKPKIEGPYPSEVVKAREYLLLAQVRLANAEDVQRKGNRLLEILEFKAYKNLMKNYYDLKNNLLKYY